MAAPGDALPILVTGATGYLGERVVQVLAARGAAVRLLCRRPPDATSLPPRGDVAIGDVRDARSIARAAGGCGAIVHLAGRVTRGGRRADFDAVNVEGLRHVLAAAAACRATVERVVCTSSVFALGPSDRPGVDPDGIDESALAVPAEELDHYQTSKRAGALLARDAARAGAPVVTLFPGLIVGSGRLNESNVVTTMVRDHLAGRLVPLPAGGRGRWSYVHVDDVAEAHALALERGVLGAEYALSAESRTLRELFALVTELTGRQGPTLPIPRALMWGVGAGEELLELAIGRPPRHLTRGAARLMCREWALSSDRATREMGWRARSLREALRETIAWLELEGHVPKGTLLPDASTTAAS